MPEPELNLEIRRTSDGPRTARLRRLPVIHRVEACLRVRAPERAAPPEHRRSQLCAPWGRPVHVSSFCTFVLHRPPGRRGRAMSPPRAAPNTGLPSGRAGRNHRNVKHAADGPRRTAPATLAACPPTPRCCRERGRSAGPAGGGGPPDGPRCAEARRPRRAAGPDRASPGAPGPPCAVATAVSAPAKPCRRRLSPCSTAAGFSSEPPAPVVGGLPASAPG